MPIFPVLIPKLINLIIQDYFKEEITPETPPQPMSVLLSHTHITPTDTIHVWVRNIDVPTTIKIMVWSVTPQFLITDNLKTYTNISNDIYDTFKISDIIKNDPNYRGTIEIQAFDTSKIENEIAISHVTITDDIILYTDPIKNIIQEVINKSNALQEVYGGGLDINQELVNFTDEVRNSVRELHNIGLMFIGKAQNIGNYLISLRFGKINKFDTLEDLQAGIKDIPNGSIIAVKNNVLPFRKSGEQVLIESLNPEPILLTALGVIFSWKFINAILTAMGLYVIYQVFRQPEASIIDETQDTITITTAGRVIVLNRHTGEIISDTGDPKTPIEAITQNDKLLLIGGGAVGGFILASLLRR